MARKRRLVWVVNRWTSYRIGWESNATKLRRKRPCSMASRFNQPAAAWSSLAYRLRSADQRALSNKHQAYQSSDFRLFRNKIWKTKDLRQSAPHHPRSSPKMLARSRMKTSKRQGAQTSKITNQQKGWPLANRNSRPWDRKAIFPYIWNATRRWRSRILKLRP